MYQLGTAPVPGGPRRDPQVSDGAPPSPSGAGSKYADQRLTKIGDSTGLVIDKPILDLLGLARGDEVELKVENERLIVGPVDPSSRGERRRAKFAMARARVHANVGGALQKLAK